MHRVNDRSLNTADVVRHETINAGRYDDKSLNIVILLRRSYFSVIALLTLEIATVRFICVGLRWRMKLLVGWKAGGARPSNQRNVAFLAFVLI